MKKLLTVLVALLMLFAVTGCSSKDAQTADDGEPKIVFITPLIDNAIFDIAHNSFRKALEDNGWNGEVVGPVDIDPDAMANYMDIAIAEGAKGVVTQGLMPGAAIDKAVKAGVTVMFIDADNQASGGTFAYLNKDFTQQAEKFYEEACKYVGQDEKMIVGIQRSTLETESDVEENDAIEAVFSKHPGGYELTNVTLINSDTATSVTRWKETFETYPEINVAINCAAEGIQGCCKAADEEGVTGKVCILGVDDLDVSLDLIREGKCQGTVAVSFWTYGYQSAVWLHQHIVEGRNPAQRFNPAAIVMVTKDNVDTYATELETYENLPE